MTPLLYGITTAQLERQVRPLRRLLPELADIPLDSVLERVWADFNSIIGTPDQVNRRIEAYSAAGEQEFILEWFDTDNLGGLEDFSGQVLAYV